MKTVYKYFHDTCNLMFIYLMALYYMKIAIFEKGYETDPKTFIVLKILGGE